MGRPLFNGKAMISVHDSSTGAVGDYHCCLSLDSVATNDINLRTTAGGNLTFQADRGTTLSLRFKWHAVGSGNQPPTHYGIAIYNDDGPTLHDPMYLSGTSAVPADGVEVVRSGAGITGSTTMNKSGTFEIYVFFQRDLVGTTLDWFANSIGTTSNFSALNLSLNNADMGRIRIRDTLSSFATVRNDNSAIPSSKLVPRSEE